MNNNENKSNFVKILNTSCGLLYIYLKELAFRSSRKAEDISLQIANYINFIEDFNSNDHDFNFYKEYGRDKLHLEIFRNVFHSDQFIGLINAESKLNEIKYEIENWENSFNIKKNDVVTLEKRLEEVKSAYDFVLLNKGFKELYDQKKKELKRVKNTYSFIAATMFLIPFVELGALIGAFFYFDGNLPTGMWFTSIPFITLILITLYLLKISLQDKRSIQSQMMQLELRMALCQFIHNYADDSEKLHAKNKTGFEKFENIIFSPLVSSDDKIPTTFDGMEQLAKLVSEFRK